MTKCYLHNFDRALCGQVVWNVRRNLDEPRIRQAVERLRDPLTALIIDEFEPNLVVAPIPIVVLSEAELDAIAESVSFLPIWADRCWQPLTSQYRDATLCTGEIRRRLAPAEAAQWSTDAVQFTRELHQPQLELSEGIAIVNHWTREIRRYLEALGEYRYLPRPEGQFPTPTRPEEGVRTEPVAPELAYLDRMRAAIANHQDGRQASPDELLALASANRQFGRKALRILEKQGEYLGFDRPARSC